MKLSKTYYSQEMQSSIRRGVVIMSTSTSTQIPNQKTGNKKTDISREQHSKQANIRQEKL